MALIPFAWMRAATPLLAPLRRLTSSAWLREAEAWTLLGDEAKIEATLAAIPKQFPAGDMRAGVVEDLGAGAAGAGIGHLPEIV